MGVVMTLGLYFISQGDWPFAFILYVIATIGFSGANVFYDSLLPSIASEKKLDFVSALGYSLGYLGGGLLFAINVWMAMSPETFGFTDETEAAKFSLITVGIWWGAFTIPVLVLQAEKDTAVTSRGQEEFCKNLKAGGKNQCEGGIPVIIRGAYHELFIEKDEYRIPALTKILDFITEEYRD